MICTLIHHGFLPVISMVRTWMLYSNSCWFDGSSFKGFSIVFPAPWLAKVESSQKSKGMWFFRHFFVPSLFDRSRNKIGVTNNPAGFGAKKCSENHIWRCWDDSRSMEPTISQITLSQPESTVSNFMPSKKNFITGQSKVWEPDVAVGKSTLEYLSRSGTFLVFP